VFTSIGNIVGVGSTT